MTYLNTELTRICAGILALFFVGLMLHDLYWLPLDQLNGVDFVIGSLFAGIAAHFYVTGRWPLEKRG